MLNFGESPRAAAESRLSQILEENPPPRYFLSERAKRHLLIWLLQREFPVDPEFGAILMRCRETTSTDPTIE